MKIFTPIMLAAMLMLMLPIKNSAQVITPGTTSNFAIFSTDGDVSNSGISQVTGNVGTNNGSSTAFGNVNGVMHDNDSASAQCSTDLLVLYGQLNGATPTFFPAPLLGNGDTLTAGVYYVSGASTLDLNLFLDAENNPNAIFIFQIQGSLSTGAGAKVKLINDAQACNVYWKVEGLVDMATDTKMSGTIVANNSAILMNTGDTLEGRALSIAGAITIDGVLLYTPVGCGSPLLTGPDAPALGFAGCYVVFSSNGGVTNTGVSNFTGDVGTNVGLTSGFDPLNVDGVIHPIPDISTAACAADLLIAFNYLNLLPNDIELLYPAQFGNNLVLTPHTYVMNGAVTFTDSLFLNAMGDANAIFVIKVYGAVSTSTYAKVILINNAQAENVYWMISGSVNINEYSIFNGSIICNNGAMSVNSLATINGRILTTGGAVSTAAITATALNIPSNCMSVDVSEYNNASINIYPNPFSDNASIKIDKLALEGNVEVRFTNILGCEVMRIALTQTTTSINTSMLPQGVYFYNVYSNNSLIETGKLISQ